MMFMLPNNQQRYKTIVGSLCTILTIGIVFIYAVYKFQLLSNREQNSLSIITELGYFQNRKNEFNLDNFKIAFGLAKMVHEDSILQSVQ